MTRSHKMGLGMAMRKWCVGELMVLERSLQAGAT